MPLAISTRKTGLISFEALNLLPPRSKETKNFGGEAKPTNAYNICSYYKKVPAASNRKKAQISGGKKFDISRRNEIRGCQTAQKLSHVRHKFDSYDELEQKMIEIAEKLGKTTKLTKISRLITCKTVLLILNLVEF